MRNPATNDQLLALFADCYQLLGAYAFDQPSDYRLTQLLDILADPEVYLKQHPDGVDMEAAAVKDAYREEVAAMTDTDLLRAYNLTDGVPGNLTADMLIAEIARGNLDV